MAKYGFNTLMEADAVDIIKMNGVLVQMRTDRKETIEQMTQTYCIDETEIFRIEEMGFITRVDSTYYVLSDKGFNYIWG